MGDDMSFPMDDAAAHVRYLAGRGLLAERAAMAAGSEYGRLCAGAYEIVWPLVFEGLTRRLEFARGHPRCAAGVRGLEPDCLDRFQDDVEAVLDDLLRNAKVPLRNLDGWIRSRLVRSTVDGHRRRRGERGAQQRPRVPRWLAKPLGDDRWYLALAVEIQTWVGVPVTAGADLWPYGAWARRRAAITGDATGTEQDVAHDVETVLAAMRRNPVWYERFIETPLGRKQAPLAPAADTGPGREPERAHLEIVRPDERDDALLREFAAEALEVIESRVAAGEDPHHVVAAVLGEVFAAGTGAEHLDRPPGTGAAAEERVRVLVSDPVAVDRLVRQIIEILGTPGR